MKRLLFFSTILAITAISCRKIEVDGDGTTVINPPPTGGGQTINLSGKITKDTVLSAANTYILKGPVYITNNAKITIEAGTTIKGQFTDPVGMLVITRGAKIEAKGTQDAPIVFTSASPVPKSGDWAGIVILGKAKTNAVFNTVPGVGEIEGGVNDGDGNGLYGGTDDNDNSGILQYVRIEYAGFAFLPDKEVNSLTMGGVGKGTTIDHVQVSYAKDDAFEWFGGNVNCNYLIAYKTQDDDFDTDAGFSGKIQFGLIVRDSAIADISRSEAFESDNDPNGTTTGPLTSPVFSNITAIGPKATLANNGNSLYLAAVQIRRNSQLSIFNSVFLGWPIGILIDGSRGRPTDLNINDSTLRIRNTIIAGSTAGNAIKYTVSTSAPTGASDASIINWFNTPFFGNTIYSLNDDAKFVNPFNFSSIDPTPFGTSPAATGAAFTDPKLAGFKSVTFRGAIAPGGADATWWKGWTRFN
ncbi:MAG: hypothetical protein H7Y27_01585 [Gemmatimonadaceae bacterium]|nr:hypothetical protein [Chitinophagaceae bacterium]